MVVLGTGIVHGKDDESVVVGLPYAWVGESYKAAFTSFSEDRERRVGTIGKIDFSVNRNLRPTLIVPKPQRKNQVTGLGKRGGSIWGSESSYLASRNDPVRNQNTGTSIAKGKFLIFCEVFFAAL